MTETIIYKTCSKCKQSKPDSEFSIEKRKQRTYRLARCKDCVNEYYRKYYNSDLEKRRKLRKARYERDDKAKYKETLRKQKIYGTTEWFHYKWRMLQMNARKRDIFFDLKVADIRELYSKYSDRCPICQEYMDKPSVDRVNNELGYIEGNCALICYGCNAAKNCITPLQLKLIYQFVFGNIKPSDIYLEVSADFLF